MLTRKQLVEQFVMQDNLNLKINPQWRDAGYNWSRAVMMESAEALDHLGWKWWKARTKPNKAQFKLELVDIWHFILASMLAAAVSHDDAASIVEEELTADCGALVHGFERTKNRDTSDVYDKLHILIGSAAMGNIPLKTFESVMKEVGMTWDELHRMYIGKNILNLFRNDHGYADGTYVKTWSGHEDNEVLAEVMERDPDATPLEVYQQLERLYSSITTKEAA